MDSSIRVFLFKNSYEPFVALLQEQDLKFSVHPPRPGVVMASGFVIEISNLPSAALYSAVASVILGFLKNQRSRKVSITTRDNTVISAEGLSQSELEGVIAAAKNIAAIQTADDSAASAKNSGSSD